MAVSKENMKMKAILLYTFTVTFLVFFLGTTLIQII